MADIFCEQLQALDDQSAALILQLQLEDTGSILLGHKGKGIEGTVSDRDYAMQLYRQELEETIQILADRMMGRSIADAIQADRHILAEVFQEEDVAVSDRSLARELSGQKQQRTVGSSGGGGGESDGEGGVEELAKLAALYHSEEAGTEILVGTAESSKRGKMRKRTEKGVDRICEVCREEWKFFDVARLRCGHEYCRGCLDQLFRAATKDEALFPPRCCRLPVSPSSVRLFLPPATLQAFEQKRTELETPNRTYCCAPRCSAFVPLQNIHGDVAVCAVCRTRTCTTCKAAAHTGDCPSDTALQQLLHTATENNWQRCYGCWRVVQLSYGCHHMTCICGAQFCYLCGQRWKTCTCEEWAPHRLLARAEEIADREPIVDVNYDSVVEEVEENEPDLVRAPPTHSPAVLSPALPPLLLPPPTSLRPDPEPASVPASPPASPSRAFSQPTAQQSPLTAPLRDLAIEDLMRQLQQHHECVHARWHTLPGRHRCEECTAILPRFILECRTCRLRACVRCRRNRLGQIEIGQAVSEF